MGSYDPDHLNVCPPAVSIPDISTPLDNRYCLSLSSKSLPTTATTATEVKKLAAMEKYVADPPKESTRDSVPKETES